MRSLLWALGSLPVFYLSARFPDMRWANIGTGVLWLMIAAHGHTLERWLLRAAWVFIPFLLWVAVFGSQGDWADRLLTAAVALTWIAYAVLDALTKRRALVEEMRWR